MWLLDANIDVHLVSVLNDRGILCEIAAHRGWNALSNGELVAAAVAAGFDCLLTRDRLFAMSARNALKQSPQFSVILVNLPQQQWPRYLDDFVRAWSNAPIVPQPGRVIEWPMNVVP